VGCSHCHVWLAAFGACWALSIDSLSYGRSYCCAQGPASLCMSASVCLPSSPCRGRVSVCVCGAAAVFLKVTLPQLVTST
jgi:hypothetical protein